MQDDDIDEPVHIVPYNAAWPIFFQEEQERLKRILSEVKIEHIGSTAVPQVSSKPIIDIMIGVTTYPH